MDCAIPMELLQGSDDLGREMRRLRNRVEAVAQCQRLQNTAIENINRSLVLLEARLRDLEQLVLKGP